MRSNCGVISIEEGFSAGVERKVVYKEREKGRAGDGSPRDARGDAEDR